MKKLFNILLSILICGLFLVGYSNAMTYTVEGNNTKIAIPEDKCEGVTIKWCADCDSINFALSTPECTGNTLGGVNHIECTHTYDTNNTYTITVTPTNTYNTYSSIYISDANIKSITNFNGFSNISNLYLNNNQNIEIGNSTFNSLNNGVNIYLENNKLTQYSTNINNISWLSLQHNELTTIPSNIWDARQGNYIELSNEVRYGSAGSSTKKFYLSHNNINFVGITKVNNYDTSNCNYYNNYCDFNNETNYNFEWFGYSYNTTPLEYDYEIIGTTIEDTTNSTGVTINEPLNAGSYTFKVCIHGSTEYCDTFDFDIDYDENLYFITGSSYPASNGVELSSINGIKFYWNRTGNYPEEFLSGYTYSLVRGTSETIIPETTPSLSTTSLDSISLPSDPNGTYTFTVKLKNHNSTIDTITRTFTIAIDNTINIENPRTSPSYTGAGITTVSVPLKWSTTSSLFSKYSYYITTNSGCSETNIVKSEDNITEKSFNDSVNLGDGEYYLCITMHASNGNSQGETKFSVDIPSTIQITSPTNGADITTAETVINWNGFTPYTLTNYTYELLDEHFNPISGAGGTTGNTSITYKNLGDGSYTFNVTLNDNSGKSPVSTGVSFTISSSAGKYVNIKRPVSGNHTGENVTGLNINFYWEGSGSTLFHQYRYTLKQGDNIIKSGTTNKIQSGSIDYILPSGSYKFYVDMLDSDSHVITSGRRTFNVVIPPTLTISKPIPGQQSSKDIEFNWTGFAEFFGHYQYTLSGWNGSTLKTGQDNISKDDNYFKINNLHHGEYRFTVNIIKTGTTNIITGKYIDFGILDEVGLVAQISQDGTPISDSTIKSRTGTFSWYGQSEDFSGYYYSITGTTFTGAIYEKTGYQFGDTSGSVTFNDLSTGKYKFMVKMLSGPDKDTDVITGTTKDFNVAIPASLTIITPSEGAKIESATATVSWTGYNDTEPLYSYMIKKGSTVLDTSNLTDNTSFTRSDYSNGSYSVTIYMLSGWAEVATKTVNFTVDIPVKSSGGGGSSSKSHPTNNLKLSIGNESPSSNEWIELIVKIDEKYTGKVTFPKIQYYSGSKWIDIPVTSKNYISDYSDDAKLGYVKFSSDDDGKKTLSQFIKFSKNGNYRIYAEDKDGYDTYVQLKLGPKQVEIDTGHNAAPDTEEEIYIARSCKKYTIIYSDTLNIYTSPNLNISEFFMNKDYLKRYLDSKNRRQSGCPTNVGWISTSHLDRTNDNERYTAPNGKVYFIVGQEGDYYSNELNRELKTPTSFRTIQELKYYIRDRNPLINMAALGPVN